MRINFLGGPGAGKSRTAAWVFSQLKKRNYSVELITEYVKSWAASKRSVNEFDQVFLFGKQMQMEYVFLKNGVKNIITDSPTSLSHVYADRYFSHINIGEYLRKIDEEYEKKYPSLNIFLNRKDKIYDQESRYQNYNEALEIDSLIKKSLNDSNKLVKYLDYDQEDLILNTIIEHLTI